MVVTAAIVLGVDGKIRKLSKLFLAIIILIIIVSGIWFLIPFFEVEEEEEVEYETGVMQEQGDPTREKELTDCCTEYFESNFTSFSNCPPSFYLGLTSAIIKQNESALEFWKSEKDPNEDKRILFVSLNGEKIGKYFIYLFGNKYLGKNNDLTQIKEELMNACKAMFENREDCEERFSELLDIESEPYFPGTALAKSYFEPTNAILPDISFCRDGISLNLCQAMREKNKTLCNFPSPEGQEVIGLG
jgi:hypothetical protein